MKRQIIISFGDNSTIDLNGKTCLINSFCGSFLYDPETDSKKILTETYKEAQGKYSRMHYGDPATRFEKSWTGYIGELCVLETLKNKLSLVVDESKHEIDEKKYDGGDIHFTQNKRKYTVNVSSRKLSLNDQISSVILKPDQYFILIPVDQLDQYINRADLAFFVFIKFNADSLKQIEVEGIKIGVYCSGDFIIPGFLKSTDILYLKKSENLFKAKKATKLEGLYGDMTYSVTMYTDNYVIFTSQIRKFRNNKE